MSRAYYELDVMVLDEAALRAFAGTLNDGFEGDEGLADLLVEVASNARVAPLDAGYEIVRAEAFDLGGGASRVRVEAEVHDGAALAAASRSSYALSWGGADWEPADLGEALYEQSFASNASPAPVEVGFEVRDRRHGGDPVPAASPAP